MSIVDPAGPVDLGATPAPAPRPRRGLFTSLGMVFRALVFFFCLAWFWFGAFVLAWTVVPALLLVRDQRRRRRIIQRIVARCFGLLHGLLAALRLYRVRWTGRADELAVFDTPAVIVANHPSLLDFTAIASHWPSLCCVVKPLLMGNPFVGPLLRACGHIDGGGSKGAAERLGELKARLAEGHPVLIFPEGTRSPRFGLHALRRGAFTLAVMAEVPVQPLILDCTPPALGKDVSVWDYPSDEPVLTIEVADVIPTAGRIPGAIRDQFDAMVRARMAERRKTRQPDVAA